MSLWSTASHRRLMVAFIVCTVLLLLLWREPVRRMFDLPNHVTIIAHLEVLRLFGGGDHFHLIGRR